MAKNTISEVISAEERVEALREDFAKRLEGLQVQNDQQVSVWQEEADQELEQYKELQATQLQAQLSDFQTSENNKAQEAIAQLRSDFSEQYEDLVQYVVREVTQAYGNR
ncbi:hypothetical protein AWM75_04125 [Aerococcus urinaehominis]|uniref:Uncharacterized protein n=1 Tax=Aerococcus urinaehominis TaxID=128944 RepID=A0A0X8FKZ0_9LACT|nr:hypothetical protein [Aerococcus urinaehominis]AMB99243.1 hypothetical protein AWM75_04125 [Aerococcus urinaehominis]SDM31317.1 hypothetical protein SAMN04487985_11212 [Aerococcus urinaehominis]